MSIIKASQVLHNLSSKRVMIKITKGCIAIVPGKTFADAQERDAPPHPSGISIELPDGEVAHFSLDEYQQAISAGKGHQRALRQAARERRAQAEQAALQHAQREVQ